MVLSICGGTRRTSWPLPLVPLHALEQRLGKVTAERLAQLLEVLDGVLALPERALPLGRVTPLKPGSRCQSGSTKARLRG